MSSTESTALKVRHLDHLNLTVRDLPKTLNFYRELLGFEIVERGVREDGIPWCIVKSGEALLCLYEFPELKSGPAYPELPAQQGLSHFAFRIDSGEAIARKLKEVGIELLFGGAIEWPHSTSYYLSDPTGHHIELVDWKGGKIQFEPLQE